jgi:hypothetical protein
VIEFRGIEVIARRLKSMELTIKSATPLARRRAKGAPLFPAAYPRRLAARSDLVERAILSGLHQSFS